MDSIQSKNEIISSLGGKKKLESVLFGILKWIDDSFEVNNRKGSSAFQTIFNKWSPAYPETTGYLLNTLIKVYDYTLKDSYLTQAERQLTYFAKLQNNNGSFPYIHSSTDVFFFDNSQILLGLIGLNEKLTNNTAESIIHKCYAWLIQAIDESGQIKHGNYKANYTPSYYARSSWALAKYESIYLSEFSPQLLLFINYIKTLQNPNKSFNSWSFNGSASAFSHTIIYTLRGLWETALITKNKDDQTSIILSIDYINEVLLKNGNNTFYGLYNKDWLPDKSFICTAGTAQLIVLLNRIYKHTGNSVYLSNIPALMTPLLDVSRKSIFKNHNAVPSSIPIWGKYQRFRYTNWTQKFVVDALLEILNDDY